MNLKYILKTKFPLKNWYKTMFRRQMGVFEILINKYVTAI